MDKNGLGPVMDENGNVKYEMSKEEKINIFADTLLGIGATNSNPSSLLQMVNPRLGGIGAKPRDHVAIDMFDANGSATTEYYRNSDSRSRSNSRNRTMNPDKLRLHHVFVSANECVDQLEKIRRRLAQFASRDEQIAKGQKVLYPVPDFVQLADLAYQIMSLSREAFVPAHRLCSAVIGLYMTEDYIREPTHTEFPDYFEGRVRIPSKRSNRKTLLQLHMCVDTVTEFYAKFQPFGSHDRNHGIREFDEMRGILLMMRHIIQELYSTGSGCFDLLNILLYIDPPEQEAFKEFLNNLNSMEKSDLLEGISKLRRTVDHIPLLLEKLSWASYTVFRLASGKSPLVSPNESPAMSISSSKQSLEISKHKMDATGYQASASGSSKSKSSKDSKKKQHQSAEKKRSESRISSQEEFDLEFQERPRSKSKEKLALAGYDGQRSRSKEKKHKK